jgi:transcriptional regulator with XRE-family HTH domain
MARKTFDHLWRDIVAEAKAEGRDAEEQLEDFSSAFAWARKLAFARKGKKLSQGQVEKLTGIPQSEISRIESGAANPTIQTVQRLGAAYDLYLDFVPWKQAAKSTMTYFGLRHGTHARGTRSVATGTKKEPVRRVVARRA